MFNPPIKGNYPNKPTPPTNNFAGGMGDLAILIQELRQLKQELPLMFNNKLSELENKINSKMAEMDSSIQENSKAAQILESGKTEVVDLIANIKKGDPGTPADEEKIYKQLESKIPTPIDIEALTRDILSQVPKLDTGKLTKQILKAIPENKASLKIIQESFVTDPMSVIDKIMELAKQGKFKLDKSNISGLEQTMSAFSNQLGKGYLHGGGDTVTAGTNISITTNSAGQKVIASTLPVLAGVTSLNALTGAIVFLAGTGITLNPVGQNITINSTASVANAITAVANAATVPVTSKNNIVTNNSAATLTITLTTTGAVNMQDCIVQILDFSGVAQTITWVNTENSTVSAPTTSNGSTTLPLTVGFKYNSLTSKWRCVASA